MHDGSAVPCTESVEGALRWVCNPGRLPSEWGSDHKSLQRLAIISLRNTAISSTLPAVWGTQLPSLSSLNFAYGGQGGANLSGAPTSLLATDYAAEG